MSLRNALADFQRNIAVSYQRRRGFDETTRYLLARVADELAAQSSFDVPPVSVMTVAAKLNVRIVYSSHLASACGELRHENGVLTAVVNKRLRDPFALHFTIAHEVGHSLFYYRDAFLRPTRIVPVQFAGGEFDEEAICDNFARALLIRRSWAEHVARCRPWLSQIVIAAKTLHVPMELLLSRICDDIGGWPNMVFCKIERERESVTITSIKGKDAGMWSGVERAIRAVLCSQKWSGVPGMLRSVVSGVTETMKLGQALWVKVG
jgi:hypothetical protein